DAQVAEDHRAERAEEEPGRADPEGQQDRVRVVAEELGREDGGDVEVDREVVPLDDRAEGGDDHRLAPFPCWELLDRGGHSHCLQERIVARDTYPTGESERRGRAAERWRSTRRAANHIVMTDRRLTP